MTNRLMACAVLIVLAACGSGTPSTPSIPTVPTPPTTTNTATFSGTIRDVTGAPLAAVNVYVGFDPRSPSFRSAATDASGRFAITGLAPAVQRVYVSKPGYISIDEQIDIRVEPTRDFAMRPGIVVDGRTVEDGVGPLSDVTITVTSGPNAGVETTSGGPLAGFSLPAVLPGDFTIRASKKGFESVVQAIHAETNTYLGEIVLRWSYGECLTSVSPITFERTPAAGMTDTIRVEANGARAWTARPDVPWIDVVSSASATGSATIRFQVQSNPTGALESRAGVIHIRCSDTEGQDIHVTQAVDCKTTLEWANPQQGTFPASGGTGTLNARNGVAGCRSSDHSEVDWIHLVGAGSYMTGQVAFIVDANNTGAERSGIVVAGETRWTIKQAF